MKFHIDTASDIPNYLQLEHQIKTACLQRKLKPGDQLPSIRALAKELSIAIITIKRAYDDLQAEGIIELRHGKGCFIKEIKTSRLTQQNQILLNNKITELIHYAKDIGCTDEEITNALIDAANRNKEDSYEH